MDQRDAYIADGLEVYEATEHAIRQIGEPIVVDTQLDRMHRHKAQGVYFDWEVSEDSVYSYSGFDHFID